MKVADLLVEKIKKDYRDDISIVALCGSYIYDDTHPMSDLDFYFIPKTERGYEMAQGFILEDIGFDFWGMSWDRAESLAKYKETNTSIISKARIIYWSSQSDLERFNALRNLGENISHEEFLSKSIEQAAVCQDFYFKMLESKSDFSVVKQNAICILYYSAFSIALLNGGYIERGGRNLLNEVLAMKLYPNEYKDLYEKIIQSNHIEEIINSAQSIIMNLRSLIQMQQKIRKESITQGFYEELKSTYNKLLHECETGNQQGIMLAITKLIADISLLFTEEQYSDSNFPDLFLISQKRDINELIRAIQVHEKVFIDILRKEKIPVVRYKNLNELRNHLDI